MTRKAPALEFSVSKIGVCASTNEVAKEMAYLGAAEGTVVVAEEQTAGRGTKGRTWHSARGLGLYVSLILRPRPAARLSLLPLAAGLAAREAVEIASGLAAGLRWPNDLVLTGKKLGGILCETEFSGAEVVFAVVGLGVNLAHRPFDFPAGLRDLAVSIAGAGGRCRADSLLEAYLAEFKEWYGDAIEGRAGRLVRAFELHSVFKPGDEVTVEMTEGRREGRYLGLAVDGTIRLAFEDGERRLASADVVRIGRPPSI